MDACYMRDAVLPLEADQVLPLTVHTYGYTVQARPTRFAVWTRAEDRRDAD